METEKEKAEETIKWMGLFDAMLSQAYMISITHKGLYLTLKGTIDSIKRDCENILENN